VMEFPLRKSIDLVRVPLNQTPSLTDTKTMEQVFMRRVNGIQLLVVMEWTVL